jgi:hypothetical protein
VSSIGFQFGSGIGPCCDAGGGYDVAVAVDIDGEVDECFTRLTSVVPFSSHRSHVRTKNVMSISLAK